MDEPQHARTRVIVSCSQMQRSGSLCGPSTSRAHGSEQWAAWFGSRSNWLQFVSRCGDVCVAKSPRPMSTSTGVCLTAVVEVDVCVASEPHGLDERGSNESSTVMVCTVVGPVAVGCSWARFPAILWSRKIRFLGYLAPQRVERNIDPTVTTERNAAPTVTVPHSAKRAAESIASQAASRAYRRKTV